MKRILYGALIASNLVAGPSVADSHRLQADFTFRRVAPPSADNNRRITVQVAPRAPSAPTAAGSPPPVSDNADQPAAQLAWFWTDISPALEESGPGRLEQAMKALRNPPSGRNAPTPRLQTLQGIAQAHGIRILTHTIGTRVSPALVLSVIAIESAGKADAGSSAGAQGLMQLMPDTASRFGVSDSFDPDQNIRGGVAYLDWLMGEFADDPILVLAAYNAGEGAVRRNDGVPPYSETRDYVPKVLSAWTVARALCVTPPELVTDGCVFSVSGG